MTTATACAEKAKLKAMIWTFEKIFALDENEEEEVLADTFVIAKFTANSQLSSIICEETGLCNDLIKSAPGVAVNAIAWFFYLKLKSIIVDWIGLLIAWIAWMSVFYILKDLTSLMHGPFA